MNEHEDYFRISQNGHVHTLSDRIPFNWKELLIWSASSFIVLIFILGIGLGIFVAILTLIGYIFYRFISWFYYSELHIDEKKGELTRTKKILNRTQTIELISDKFEPNRFEFTELNRSGKTKFLMNYRTHKNNELLIIKNKADKELVEKYIAEKITAPNNV